MYTGCDPTEKGTVMRRQRDGTREPIPCPAASINYNQHMGGVDLGDQLIGYYHLRMKSRKFYKYIANFLLDVTITNAFILYCASHPGTKVKNLKFREWLATDLIGDYCSRRRPGRGRCPIKPLPITHFPTKISSINSERKRGKCALCQERKHRADTQWFCRECGVWLCHQGTEDDCFLYWHKQCQSQ